MSTSFFRMVLLGLLAANTARAQQEPGPRPADVAAEPGASPAPSATGRVGDQEASEPASTPQPAGAPQPAIAPPPPPAPLAPSVLPRPAFPTTRYSGRLPPPRKFAIEPRPAPRHGDAGAPFTLGIGGNYRFRDDVGYDRLGAGDHQTELDLFASYDLLQPVEPLVIALGVDYRFGSHGGGVSVATHGIAADVTARYTLANWLFPQLRASLGLQMARLEVAESDYGVGFSDKAQSPLGSVGAGLLLRSPTRMFETDSGNLASLSLGLLIEAGYLFVRASSFRARPESDSEVPAQSIDLGKLDQSSPYLRIAAVLRF